MSEKKSAKNKSAKAGGKNGGGGGATSGAGSAGPMDVNLLQQLVELMSANDLNTVDLRDGGKRIVLKRGAAAFAAAPVVQYAAPQAAPAPSASAAASGGGVSKAAAPADEDAGLLAIKSPMVGTFYAKPSPDAKPFVNVGSTVVKDDTDVCVIEAMKVFNNIKAEVSGTIAKILVADGQTVEFGTVLFLVKP